MKRIYMMPVVLLLGVGLSGCVHTRTYWAERERVDQQVPGIPLPEKPRTRQVLVVEVSEDAGAVPVDKKTAMPSGGEKSSEGQSKVVTDDQATVIVHDSNFSFPSMTKESLTQGGMAGTQGSTVDSTSAVPVDYKVEKDDTLQKIARKFYGSYGKWTKIYDANRAVIRDPNRLKPGIMLKIPVLNKTN
jgi:nucleoid-associated protein YgaU